jgi:hypothetical protein
MLCCSQIKWSEKFSTRCRYEISLSLSGEGAIDKLSSKRKVPPPLWLCGYFAEGLRCWCKWNNFRVCGLFYFCCQYQKIENSKVYRWKIYGVGVYSIHQRESNRSKGGSSVCTSIGSSVSIILSRFRGCGGSEARRTKGWVNRLIYLWKFAAKAAGF